MLLPARLRPDIPVVPVVRLTGVIGVATPLRPGLMLAAVARSLERAFSVKRARAVALVINSPGGSPSQSDLICRRIRQLAEEKKIPVIAFIEDVGASGGYMLACAADEIVCDQYSIVGSIGVVGGSFGFPKLMEKLGIERRHLHLRRPQSNARPFVPEKPEDLKRIKAIQKEIHEQFIALVKERRAAQIARQPTRRCFPASFGQRKKRSNWGSSIASAMFARSCALATARKCACRSMMAERSLFGRRLPGVNLARRSRNSRDWPTISFRRWRRARYGRVTACEHASAKASRKCLVCPRKLPLFTIRSCRCRPYCSRRS